MSCHCELRNQLYHHLLRLTSKLPTLPSFLNGISRSLMEIGWQVPDTILCRLTSGWQNWWLNLAVGAALAISSQDGYIIHRVVSLYYRFSIYHGYMWYDNAHSITITMIKLWSDLQSWRKMTVISRAHCNMVHCVQGVPNRHLLSHTEHSTYTIAMLLGQYHTIIGHVMMRTDFGIRLFCLEKCTIILSVLW